MEESKHRCYGCGGTFAREELQYRPSGKGAYRKEIYFCPTCNEKEKQKTFSLPLYLHFVNHCLQDLAT